MPRETTERSLATMRDYVFDALDALGNKQDVNALDIEKAKVTADLCQVLINSAKVEVDYMKKTGSEGTGFITTPEEEERAALNGMTGKVHRIRG